MARTVGELIRARIDAMGVKQADLVRELDAIGCVVTKQSVNAWCLDETKPSHGHLMALWQALGISPADREPWMIAMGLPRQPRKQRAQEAGNRLEEDDIPTRFDPPTAPGGA